MLAVAGSGKTTLLVNKLSLERRALILTYTNTNEQNLTAAIIRRFGHHPKNIFVFTYYTFIYSFCYRPLLSKRLHATGINWNPNSFRFAQGDDRFIDRQARLYSNRIALLLDKKDALPEVKKRLEKYFDEIYIDEVQDFGGNDFNFLKTLAAAKLDNLFVGDFFQHTYDTSRDGNTNAKLHDDQTKYKKLFKAMGLTPDDDTLSKSHRCNPEICNFITEKLGIDIGSHRAGGSRIINVEDPIRAAEIYHDPQIVKLFYQAHYHYDCYGKNWGESKGEDRYYDVCVVLNGKTWQSFLANDLVSLAPQTKSKLYVAITRTKGDLYLLPESLLKLFKSRSA